MGSRADQPGAVRRRTPALNVATIVHEATHQIAFNCGLHTRLSDCPLWFSEGIAVYFETPDLRRPRAGRGVGAVNRDAVAAVPAIFVRTAAPDSLRTLISRRQAVPGRSKALDAYGEAWALTYFLLRQHPKQYVAYLRMLSAKKPLVVGHARSAAGAVSEAVRRLEATRRRVPPLHGESAVITPPAVAARPRGWRRRSARSARRGAAGCRRPSSRPPASARK